MTDYQSFVEAKRRLVLPRGSEIPKSSLSSHLFDWQADIVSWALKLGRACIFADCGLGKTLMQLEWARNVPGPVLVVAPLAVSHQTEREGAKFSIMCRYAARQDAVTEQITITNYERLDAFDPEYFAGIVLDESSILKSHEGKYRTMLIESFQKHSWKLACTATPAPNDHTELANHAEFVGVMTRQEMLARFFVHDGKTTQKWRIKRHATRDFWRWVASWSAILRKPSDLGYEDDGFALPPIQRHPVIVDHETNLDGWLFPVEAITLLERIQARAQTVEARSRAAADLVNSSSDNWVVWCNLNTESDALARMIPDAVEVRGSHSSEYKETALLEFSRGDRRVIVTKPTIAGFGMNWQHCANVAFVGLSDSWEQYYQAIRRCWRFGQTRPVNVYIITTSREGAVVSNIERKEQQAEALYDGLVEHTKDTVAHNLRGEPESRVRVEPKKAEADRWTMWLGDCVDVVSGMPDQSIDFSVFSPPFASLYTYTDSPNDMGNCSGHEEFMEHFRFLIAGLRRVLKPGRLVSFHCMNLPTSKVRDGVIGLTDFRGILIRAFQEEGFIYHSEVCIWKDPVTAMQRTKALGLLHKQIKKDSTMSRQGIPDYLVTMRTPGINDAPVQHSNDSFPVSEWQRIASPVWMDINPSDTLQFRSAREHADERHIAPLQLEVIRRALRLWSNPGDLVLSPFAGIGSEGFVALGMGRRFVGVELKRSYWKQACKNLGRVAQQSDDLLAEMAGPALEEAAT